MLTRPHQLDIMLASMLGILPRRLAQQRHNRHLLLPHRALELHPAQLQQVIDDVANPISLGTDPVHQPSTHLRIVLADQRLGQQRNGTHRRPKLMAQVGHEVPAHIVHPHALSPVGHHGHSAQRMAVTGNGMCADLDHPRRRTRQLHRARASMPLLSRLEQLGHPRTHQRHRITRRHHLVRQRIAGTHGAVLVHQHHAHRQLVHRELPAGPVPLGQIDRHGGRRGNRLQVGDPLVQAVVIKARLAGARLVRLASEAVHHPAQPLRSRRARPHQHQ